MTDADVDVAGNSNALECVRRLVQAEHRRDLIRFRERLHDDIVVRAGDRIVAQGPDDVALAAAREWAAAPQSRVVVEDIGVTAGLVTLRYHLVDAVAPGSAGADARAHEFAGHTVFEVQDDKIIRIWHHLKRVRDAPDSE